MKLNKEVREFKQEEYLWIKPGEFCWVELDVDNLPDRDAEVFLPAKVEEADVEARTATVEYEDSDVTYSKDIHITRVLKRDPATYPQLNDLVDLHVLNDAELHQKIKDRYVKANIFTYIGPSLLIINPFKKIPELYTDQLQKIYYDCILSPSVHKVREKPPHVWAMAANAYLELYNNKMNQACCISGESGAGKTVNTKTCMSFLTGMNDIFGGPAAKSANDAKIEDKILMCNPILEALGNAKTVRNDNSSRFGKYISLYMHNKIVVGASIESYLLEAIRVTTPNKSERNYHIFYQYLKGASDAEIAKFRLNRKPSTYTFLERSGCYDVPTVDDLAEYKDHEKSMKTLNLGGDWRDAYWRIIASVLHLSNVEYDDSDYNGSNACEVTSTQVVDDVTEVLQVDRGQLIDALTCRTAIVMGKEMVIYLDKSGCEAQSEAFGKDIYNKLFSWVVKYLNLALLPEPEKISGVNPAKVYQKIGLLDIFGFEIFDLNSIEQLCINYTNEKLHQLYVEYVFKLEVQTFMDEGLKQFLGNLSFNDNQEVIDLLAHPDTKKFSVFNLIDDQAATMSKDMNLIDQFATLHAKNPKMAFSKTKRNVFFIVHTARAVGYTIDGFCEKNKDEVPRPIIKCVISSRHKRIVDIYNQKIKDSDIPVDYLGEATKKKESFIGFKFRQQMEDLMKELRSCQCSFMRCIKPNEQKSATVWTSSLVVLQIRYLGLLDSIKIRKESYPFRFTFQRFVHRYLELEPTYTAYLPSQLDAINPDYVQLSKNILKAAIPEHTDKTQLVGRTRVFLKIEAYQKLEQVYEDAIKIKKLATQQLDKLLMEIRLRNRIVDIRRKGIVAVEIMKQLVHGMKARGSGERMRIIRSVALRLQRNFRAQRFIRFARKRNQAVITIQSAIEAYAAQMKAKEKMSAAKIILRYYRNYRVVSSLKFYISLMRKVKDIVYRAVDLAENKSKNQAAIVIQKWSRGFLTRQEQAHVVRKLETARMMFRNNRAIKIMRKYIAGRVARKRLQKVQNAASVIQAYFKMLWTREGYLNLKDKIAIIQKFVRSWLNVRRDIRKQRLAFLKEKYMPFLKKCISDQSRLYPVDYMPAKRKYERDSGLKFDEPKIYDPCQQIPPVDNSLVSKGRIYTEVIDIDFVRDVLQSYQGSWSKGYMDANKDARKNKTDCRVIEIGQHHSLVATSNGRCYCWGMNDKLQLGTEQPAETMSVFRVLKGEEKLRMIALGDSHGHILTRDRVVFSFGDNTSGQLGLGDDKFTDKIELNPFLTRAKLRSIHSKKSQNFAVTEEGELLFWPAASDDPGMAILRLPAKESVCSISLGLDFGIILADSGCLFAFGKDNRYGQLGLGHNKPSLTPTLIKHLSKDQRVDHVSCGRAHTLVLTKSAKIFSWGEGSQGQLGVGDTGNRLIPTLVKLPLPSIKPAQVCSSYQGSFALTDEGSIYWWGRNSRISQVVKPSIFRNLTDQELFPIQVRSSWSETVSTIYLEIADLRYVHDIHIGQKHTFAKAMLCKWASMGHSQFELPPGSYGTFISAKNYEFEPAEHKRSKPDPLHELRSFYELPWHDQLRSKQTSKILSPVRSQATFRLLGPDPREANNKVSPKKSQLGQNTPPSKTFKANNGLTLIKSPATQPYHSQTKSPLKLVPNSPGGVAPASPMKGQAEARSTSRTPASPYKSSTRRDQELTTSQKVAEMMQKPAATATKKTASSVLDPSAKYSQDDLIEIRRMIKTLMLKPRRQWTAKEVEYFQNTNEQPLKDKLKTVK